MEERCGLVLQLSIETQVKNVGSFYNTDKISERHRHRYEFNNEYLEFEDNGMKATGLNPKQV